MDFGVYIHIPFCTVQCPYCTFFTVLRPGAVEPMQRFATAVRREWELRVEPRLQRGDRLRTLYLGGGTPSDLPQAALVDLLHACGTAVHGGLAALDEVTVECNPESTSAALLDALRGLGVHRISLGIQALDDRDLTVLGRRARTAENLAAIDAVGARFESWSADLILGVPGSDRRRLEQALETLVAAGAPHLSFYCLELPADRARRLGDPQTEASEARKADWYLWTSAWVESVGLQHYEISSAARPGYMAAHNHAYWSGREYVGLGPGAHSWQDGHRRANRADLGGYWTALEAGVEPPSRSEQVTPNMRRHERVLVGLRRREGLDRVDLPTDLQPGLLERLVEAGLAVLDGPRLCLTPKGWLVSDAIVLQLVAAWPTEPGRIDKGAPASVH